VITRQTKLKLLAFAVLAVLGMSYLGFKYVGLDRAILGTGYDIAADFKDSGGIFVNAEVTYRGTSVGRVSDMQLTDKGVRVTLTIDPDTDPIPVDTDAVVATRSAVGEQYVDLRPKADDGPFLAEGDVIPQDRTGIPVPVEQLLLHLDGLVGSVDQDNLRVVVDELGKAFAGAGDDLGRLIDNGDLLLARAEQSLPQTLKLITDGQTVLQTQVDSRSAIQQWAADLHTFTDTLVDIDPDLRGLVVNAPNASAQLEQLLKNAGPGLGSLVRNLDILNGVTIPRLDGVEQMLVTYPDVVSGNFTVVRRDPDGQMRSHFGFVLNAGDPKPCTTGYLPSSQFGSPGAVENADVDQARCAVINGVDPNPGDGYDESGSDIRGAQNIGRSGGQGAPTTPAGSLPGTPDPRAALGGTILGQVLHANPFAFNAG
jgi:phospholipid/cholesterol/gamma-HCH transport system substrate-binding protein